MMKALMALCALFALTIVGAAQAAPSLPKNCIKLVDINPQVLIDHPLVDMCWEYPGMDPAFPNRTVAMTVEARQTTFAKFRAWTPGLVQAAITATNAPARTVRIVNGNFFNDLAMGNGVVRHNVLANFYELPQGIFPYTGGMFLYADMWEFTYEGKRYRIFLPHICYNWGDKVYEGPPPEKVAPPPRLIEEPCTQVAYKMNKGDTILSAVASDEDLAPSWCEAQMKPGETHFEIQFRKEVCIRDCSLEFPARDLKKPIIKRTYVSFTATQNGYYIRRFPRIVETASGVYYPIACLHRFDGHRSWGKYTSSDDYAENKAFVEYDPAESPAGWHGHRVFWIFQPFFGERNSILPPR